MSSQLFLSPRWRGADPDLGASIATSAERGNISGSSLGGPRPERSAAIDRFPVDRAPRLTGAPQHCPHHHRPGFAGRHDMAHHPHGCGAGRPPCAAFCPSGRRRCVLASAPLPGRGRLRGRIHRRERSAAPRVRLAARSAASPEAITAASRRTRFVPTRSRLTVLCRAAACRARPASPIVGHPKARFHGCSESQGRTRSKK